MFTSHQWRIAAIAATLLLAAAATQAQSITGTVVDPTGAVVPNAAVEIHNPVSRYDRSTTTDASGKFSFQKRSLQPLPPAGHCNWIRSLRAGCRGALGGTDRLRDQVAGRERCDGRDRGGRGRPGRE